MKPKLLEMVEVTVFFCHTDEFIFVWSFKNGNGAKTALRVPKLGYFDGRMPNLSSRVTLATCAGGPVWYVIYTITEKYFADRKERAGVFYLSYRL